MPKKTRKQKLASDERHLRGSKTHIAPIREGVTAPVPSPDSGLYSFVPVKISQSGKPATVHESVRLAAIKSDLLKTLILAAVAIGIEIFLYWRFR